MLSEADAMMLDVEFNGLWLFAEVGRPIRRFLISESASISEVTLETDPLFISDGLEGNAVVDLFPRLFNSALNFLFDAFMTADIKDSNVHSYERGAEAF
jgi:hypothetical protein